MRGALRAVQAVAALLAAGALAGTGWHGPQQPGIALAFTLVIATGELVRVRLPGTDHPVGPLGAAAALGYAVLSESGGEPAAHGAPQAVAVAVVATAAGLAPHAVRVRARSPARAHLLDHTARRVLVVGFAAVCFQPLHHSGVLREWPVRGAYHAVLLLVVLLLAGLCDAVLAAVLAAGRTGWPFGPLLRDQLRATVGVVPAIAATGAVLALAVAVAGLWALPVFCLPLLLTQFSFRRFAAVRATYRETIASLARATEVAGYTPHGHARRVAALSRAMARELGMAEPELTVLEYAALMHDIGQLSLLDAVTGGATEPLEEAQRRRIARLGGAVVRQTGVPEAVAAVVERQADPYREQPVTARVVRVANAYEDLTAEQDGAAGSLRTLERLRLGSAYDYDPRVVEALARVVAAGGIR